MTQHPEKERGTLYVVATPIGNLEDITLRARRILEEVDCIAAEDTRHTRKLLNHLGIRTPTLAYYREKEQQRSVVIVDLLRDGKDVALVSDAGTPAVADPGSVVVRTARAEGFAVIAVPGPSALTAALSCAGLEERPVTFYGFAPAKKNQRRQLLASLQHLDVYAVFYESPHRIVAFLRDALATLGDRSVFMARELTKAFEETQQTTVKSLLAELEGKTIRGEFVLILAPGAAPPSAEMDLDELICWCRDQAGMSLKDCSRKLAADLGLARSKIYKRALELYAAPEPSGNGKDT